MLTCVYLYLFAVRRSSSLKFSRVSSLDVAIKQRSKKVQYALRAGDLRKVEHRH